MWHLCQDNRQTADTKLCINGYPLTIKKNIKRKGHSELKQIVRPNGRLKKNEIYWYRNEAYRNGNAQKNRNKKIHKCPHSAHPQKSTTNTAQTLLNRHRYTNTDHIFAWEKHSLSQKKRSLFGPLDSLIESAIRLSGNKTQGHFQMQKRWRKRHTNAQVNIIRSSTHIRRGVGHKLVTKIHFTPQKLRVFMPHQFKYKQT